MSLTINWDWRLTRAGRKDEAAVEVQKGRELSSADDRKQNANLDIAEGQAALAKGDNEQAIVKFRHALNLQPESAEAQHYLGVALEGQGDSKSASAAFRKALELNPSDVYARQRLDKLNPTVEVDDPAKIAEFKGYIREARYKEVEPLLTGYVTSVRSLRGDGMLWDTASSPSRKLASRSGRCRSLFSSTSEMPRRTRFSVAT